MSGQYSIPFKVFQEHTLQVQITSGERWKRHIEVNLPASDFEPRVARALRDFQKQANIHGFRKGKAPLPLLDKMYGDAVRQQTIDEMLPELLTQVRQEHHLHTLGPARIEEVKYDPAAGLKFRATVEVEPDFELKSYTGFSLDKIVYEVTDEDVNDSLERLRESHGWLESVEDGAQMEHFVTANIQEVDGTGLPLIGKRFEDRQFRIARPENKDDEFTPQLLGVKPGDARIVVAKSATPEGQHVDKRYRVEVKEVSERKLPVLDDNLARDLGPFESLEQLRQLLRNDIQKNAEQRSRMQLREEITEEILKNNSFELPEAYMQAFENAYYEDMKERFQNTRVPDEELRAEARAQAVRYLKWRYLSERIAEVEHVHVTDEEIRDYLTAVAKANQEDPQRYVNKTFNDERGREQARERLLEDKLLSLLETRMQLAPRQVAYKERDRSRLITA